MQAGRDEPRVVRLEENVMAEERGTEQSTAGSSMERIVRNDALFREANEGIREAAEEHLEGDERVPFVCECADPNCREMLHLTLAEYQLIRSDPRLFINVPGHQASAHGWAEAVARHDGHLIVEKVGPAGDLAEELEGEELLPPRD
jgi:hypothetical protein